MSQSNANTNVLGQTEATAAIVTGASRGIGRAIALALARSGVNVGLIARNSELLEEVAAEIAEAGGTALFSAVDITDSAEVGIAAEQLARDLEIAGAPVSLLVNAAGRIDREVALWEADPAEWREIIETNLIGSFNVSNAVIPRMLPHVDGVHHRYCRVVELASGAGAKDWAKASAYTASKAGVIRLTGHMHEAGFAQGLRAFAVAPGTVRTDMTQSMELHAGRTEFTPVSATTDLVLAIHRGEIDEWSGKYLRVTHDTPASLADVVREHGAPAESARRLAVTPWGDDDPQLVEAMVPKRG
ncbi:SDR family oxidoreductase [Leucobacter sp. UT-8R-CII-1-4]|uniref:SDR family NAD(P)-dependent oxidoreductase n=1 Tax=Leucobacter sp. UT-8R-CII-1-4 TaxID=3040075 RepID=UPI0024A958C0|nr:SDR family oxidoreductase [Leucobacter sp. UT-8R-CII-1-4]MDI6021942.1 SDR family oxidoreductase [Leucobacter sp. UT-8R-CII-1-4]